MSVINLPQFMTCPQFSANVRIASIRFSCSAAMLGLNLALIQPPPASAQITPDLTTSTTITPAAANPNQFQITGGTQAGNNLFHGFRQFSLGNAQSANFQVAPNVQNVLGRVTGGQASVLNGRLQVSGAAANLFLMNPAGVLFGPNLQLNLPASFTATTANGIGFTNGWFKANGSNNYSNLTGVPTQFAFTALKPGAIVNTGNLHLNAGQSLTLLGGQLINTGTIQTAGGTVTIAAVPGEKLVRVTPQGGLLSLDLPLASRNAVGTSPTPPTSLTNLLTAVSGPQDASGLTIVDGRVQLTGSDISVPDRPGMTVVAGKVDVQGEQGGKIQITGDRLGVIGAQLNASGVKGGGTILVGGEFQGQGDLPNAQRTYVNQQTKINADALAKGQGGRIILWSDDTTSFSGDITAKGGAQGGDGGFVEVSGKSNLGFTGQVDVTAAQGQAGRLLLDPSVVNIGSATTNDAELNGDNQILAGDGGAGTFDISAGRIEDLLNTGTDVDISASSSINLTTDGNIFASSGTGGLTLSAPTINLLTNAAEAIRIDGNLNLIYTGAAPVTVDRELSTVGNLSIAAAGSLSLTRRLSSSGNIQLQANSINITNNVLTPRDINLQATSILINGGRIESSAQNINLNATNVIQIVNNAQLRANSNLNLVSQGSILGSSGQLQSVQAVNLQAQTGVDLIGSTVQSGTNIAIASATGNVSIIGTTVAARGTVQIQAQQDLNLLEVNAPATPLIVDAGGALQLTGLSQISVEALGQLESVLRSQDNLTLISNGNVTGNARFLAGGNFSVETSGGAAGNFIYTPVSSNGIVSAAGNISFGNYTGNSLKVEAGGSITQTGTIEITGANTTLSGTDPDIATLASNPSLILRAGLSDVNLAPNRLAPKTERRNNPNLPAGFSSNTPTTNPATITTGDITIASSTTAGFDAVELVAPGNITTGNIATNAGNVKLESQSGNITVQTINTRTNGGSEGGGSVDISTNGLVRITDRFDFTYQDPFPNFTTSPTSILTATSVKPTLSGVTLPGEIQIRSGGTSFVENYGNSTLEATQSGSSGLILRSSGTNSSLAPSYQDQVFLNSTGTVTPGTGGGGTGGGGTGGGGTSTGGGGTGTGGGGTGGGPTLSQNAATLVNQQQVSNQACPTGTTIAANPSSNSSGTRSQRNTTQSTTSASNCTNSTPEDEQQILRILE